MLFTDLDGTLLNIDGRVSRENIYTILRLKELGIPTFAASARAPRSVLRISKSAGLGPLSICANGAITFDVSQNKIVRHESISPANSNEIVKAVRDIFPSALLAGELINDFYAENLFFDSPIAGINATQVDNLAKSTSNGMTKIIARVPNETSETLRHELSPLLSQISDVTISGPDWIEFAPFGVSKATGVRHICQLLNINPTEVAAIGDQRNDISMLSLVGFPYCVQNAHPEVLELAKFMVPHHDESGFSHIIDQISPFLVGNKLVDDILY